MPDPKTTGHVYLPKPPEQKNIYFYVGWDAHAEGTPFMSAAAVDWRDGWMARERAIMAAIYGEIANGR